MAESQPRQNYDAETEATINKQINLELYASYVYLSMAMHFDRDDVALHEVYEFFKKRSEEEREHAHKFMKYQNKRGGRIVLQDIKCPDTTYWGTTLDAMEASLELEKSVNQSLLDLSAIGEKHGDAQFVDWLAGEYLEEQVEDIKVLSDHITNLKRVGAGLGEFLFAKDLKSD